MESLRILIPMEHVKKDSNTREMFTGVRFSGSVILCKVVESRLKCMEEELLYIKLDTDPLNRCLMNLLTG